MSEYITCSLQTPTFWKILLLIAKAVQNLARAKICHNNLRAEHICVAETKEGPVVTIIDFGKSTPVGYTDLYDEEFKRRIKVNPSWIAPETK